MHWAIVGTGKVSRQFARHLVQVPGQLRRGVLARRFEHAKAFADGYAFDKPYESLAELLKDEAVEVVYLACPTVLHHPLAIELLDAGKAVLCEKPLAITAGQAHEMVDRSRSSGKFLMEAMWMRFNPLVQAAVKAVQDGVLGDIHSVHMEGGYRAVASATEREIALADAGRGALLSHGCYAVSLALALCRTNESVEPIAAQARYTEPARTDEDLDGRVDLTFSGLLRYGAAAHVSFTVSRVAELSNELFIAGERGTLRLFSPYIDPVRMQLLAEGQPVTDGTRTQLLRLVKDQLRKLPLMRRIIAEKERGAGFRGEIVETVRCIESGAIESPLMSHAASIRAAEILDGLRALAAS